MMFFCGALRFSVMPSFGLKDFQPEADAAAGG